MAKIDQTRLLVDINGLFKGVIWRPFKSKKSWPGEGKGKGGKRNQENYEYSTEVEKRGFWQGFGKILVIFQSFGKVLARSFYYNYYYYYYYYYY